MTRKPSESGVSIGDLSRRTGVAIDTLRAWERRYGVPTPTRSRGGHRRYAERDVERIGWLTARIGEGRRIGEAIVALRLVEAASGPGSGDSPGSSLVEAALAGDRRTMAAGLDAAFGALPLAAALEHVVFPALAELGGLWAGGERTIAAEHLLSEDVGRRIASHSAAAQPAGGPVAVVFCPREERHGLGALALATLLGADGWEVLHLGTDTPVAEVADLARRRRAVATVAVCTLPEIAAEAVAEIAMEPDRSRWVLAGPAFAREATECHGIPVWGPGLEDARGAAQARRASPPR